MHGHSKCKRVLMLTPQDLLAFLFALSIRHDLRLSNGWPLAHFSSLIKSYLYRMMSVERPYRRVCNELKVILYLYI